MLIEDNNPEALEIFKKLVAGCISKEEQEELLTGLTGMKSYDIPSNKEMDECEELPQANF